MASNGRRTRWRDGTRRALVGSGVAAAATALWAALSPLGPCVRGAVADGEQPQTVFCEDFAAPRALPAGWTARPADPGAVGVRQRGQQPFLELSGRDCSAASPAIPVEPGVQYEVFAEITFSPNLASVDESRGEFRLHLAPLEGRRQPFTAGETGAVLLRLADPTEDFATFKAGFRYGDGQVAVTSLAGLGHRVRRCNGAVRYVRLVAELRGVASPFCRIRSLRVERCGALARPLFVQHLVENHRSATLARLWDNLAAGDNVALGRPVKVFPPLEEGRDRLHVLTDGKIAFRSDEGLSVMERVRKLGGRPAQGVGMPMSDMLCIRVDLGRTVPIDRVVFRVQGGTVNASPMYMFPKLVELLGSDDGRDWRRVGRWTNEQYVDRDRPGEYALPEVGDVLYLAPVAFFDVDVAARYVGLRVARYGRLLFDEIAVIRGEGRPARSLASLAPAAFQTEGVMIHPVKPKVLIANDALLPDWPVHYCDERLVTASSWAYSSVDFSRVRLHFEAPAGIALLDYRKDPRMGPEWAVTAAHHQRPLPHYPPLESVTEVERRGEPYRRYTFGDLTRNAVTGHLRFGPMCFETRLPAGAAGSLFMHASWDGGEQTPIEVPFEVYRLGSVDRAPARFYSCLGFSAGLQQAAWPGYLELCRRLGFNVLSVSPRFWRVDFKDRDWRALLEGVVQSTRAAGFRVAMQSSPWNGDYADSIFDPERRGYQEQLDRLAEDAGIIDPDVVLLDIEGLHGPRTEAQKRCVRERMQREGTDDFRHMVRRIGNEALRDGFEAVSRGMGEAGRPCWPGAPRPVHGFYYAGHPRFDQIFDLAEVYGRWLHLAMPEVYAGGDPDAAVRVVRNARRELTGVKCRIVPWLTPGTRGEYPSRWLRDQILEVLANGGHGVCYFPSDVGFDGRDFFFHAQTVAIVAKVEHLLERAAPIEADELAASDPAAKVCGLRTPDGEALILVSNYYRAAPCEVRVTYAAGPGAGARIVDVETGEPVARVGEDGAFAMTMTSDPRTRLLHILPRR